MQQHPGRRRLAAVALATLATTTALFAISPAHAATGYRHYVGLGDSFASAPLVPNVTGNPVCGQSDHNYAHQIAARLKPGKFTDASCGGATTPDMTGRQFGVIPPQFDALDRDTDLVTVHIGGNDIGFGEIVATCGTLDAANPTLPLCRQYWTAGGVDRIQQRIDATATKVTAVLQGIRQRSPQAKIVVVGAPNLLPEDDTRCWPVVPISSGDIPYLNTVSRAFNAMSEKVATTHGASYVDTYTTSIGHDMCRAPGVKWVEGIFPTDAAAPVHPNLGGTTNQAKQILAALGS
ncbi:SGNH/GDSL hydrolase family protein [Amycolatopsis sp. NPDC059021]|uniref:SGNH/GDSL hydrolase family protein n=1 Tax=Amycolatopsis sp. NPDC059021 TaxID=3346704 RepID=UPI0036732CCF